MSALTISLGGLQGASTRFDNAAQRVVKSGVSASERATGSASPAAPAPENATKPEFSGQGGRPAFLAEDTVAALVELKQSELDFKVNARVAGRVSDLYKETLSILGGREDT